MDDVRQSRLLKKNQVRGVWCREWTIECLELSWPGDVRQTGNGMSDILSGQQQSRD